MKKILVFLLMPLFACIVAACDLQPRITSWPDSVGDFISDRYPTLLADPDAQPEIYNSAASDYGVYASPELYGSVEADDYILYSDINDYMLPAQDADASDVENIDENTDAENSKDVPVRVIAEYSSPESRKEDKASKKAEPDLPIDYLVVPMYGAAQDTHEIKVVAGETLYSISRRYGATVEDIAKMNNLSAPYSVRAGQMLRVPGNGNIAVAADKTPAPVKTDVAKTPASTKVVNSVSEKTDVPVAQTTTQVVTPVKNPTPARVQLQTVTVGAGDTLYSISRRYSVPVNDLAVMNDLSVPFRLTVGQKLRVPNLSAAATVHADKKVAAAKVDVKPVATNTAKVQSSNANKAVVKSEAQKKQNAPEKTIKNAQKQKISSDPKQKLPTIAARSSSKFSWPVRGKILSEFGSKPNGLVNDGINISASRGTTVGAAENGVVAYAGNEVKGMGNLIILQHSDGWMTVYAHLDSMSVRRGAKVSVGQKIGTVGTSGKVDKPQLHFEIRKGTKAYNPTQYLKK